MSLGPARQSREKDFTAQGANVERRNFFKGAMAAIGGLMLGAQARVPVPQKPTPQEPMDGSVDLQTIASGPFVSIVDIFKPDVGLFTTVRVKIRNEVYDFNARGDIAADLADAELFMRKAGFKHWIKSTAWQNTKIGNIVIGRVDRWTSLT